MTFTSKIFKCMPYCPIDACQYLHLIVVSRYAPGTNCSYLLRGSPTQKVRIHFEKMKMTQKTPIIDVGSECSEYLALYDSDWPDPTRVIKVFCSSFSPPRENEDFVSTGAALLVTFISRSGRLFPNLILSCLCALMFKLDAFMQLLRLKHLLLGDLRFP